jgi:glycosyltransferase involved in cell wall biosynthesis
VGRLDRFKGGAVLVEAWKTLRESHPGARLHLVGGGMPEERTAMEALIARLDLGSCVRIWGKQEGPEEFYREADIFVLPSLSEGMPNALLEALAAGLPCIASDLPSTRGIVEDGRSGLLVPPGDPAALAKALGRLLADPDLRRELGRRGREHVEPWASSRIMESYLETYRGLAAAGRPRSGGGAGGKDGR